MGENLKPRTPEEMRFYNGAQLLLIEYMRSRGTITDIQDYIDHVAEIFEMVAEGTLRTHNEEEHIREIERMRQEFHDITSHKIT